MTDQEKNDLIRSIQPIEYFSLTHICLQSGYKEDEELNVLSTQINYGLAARKEFVQLCIHKGYVPLEQVKAKLDELRNR